MNLSDKDKAIVALIAMVLITLLVSYSASFHILRLKTEKSNYIIITRNIDSSGELKELLTEKDSTISNLEHEVEKLNSEKNNLMSKVEEKNETIEEKEQEIDEMKKNVEELHKENELYTASAKRLSNVLRRYNYKLKETIEEYQKDPRKFIKESKELETMVEDIEKENFLEDLYEYIVTNFYYYYDPFTVTSEGVQEWNFFLAYDLKEKIWIKVPLDREELLLSSLPETIFYPKETIELGGGDCEDLTILYAAACISQGYDAKIYVIDITSKNSLLQPISHTLVIVDNTLVDITMDQYITGKNLFQQYGNSINAEKITLAKIYDNKTIEDKNTVVYST